MPCLLQDHDGADVLFKVQRQVKRSTHDARTRVIPDQTRHSISNVQNWYKMKIGAGWGWKKRALPLAGNPARFALNFRAKL